MKSEPPESCFVWTPLIRIYQIGLKVVSTLHIEGEDIIASKKRRDINMRTSRGASISARAVRNKKRKIQECRFENGTIQPYGPIEKSFRIC